jgi:hypothetical protein
MALTSLKWHQVNAWRLAQHGLAPRLGRREYVAAAMRTGGIQAQVMSAAELALGARVDGLAPADVQTALWQERALVKTWAMRGTLHLIAAQDLPLYVAARSLYETRNWLGYFTYHGVSPALYDAFIAAAPQILGAEPMTREQFAAAVAEHLGAPALQSLVLTKGWGTPLKPLAWRGDLCFGPNQGRNTTFVRPSEWIGAWQPVEPYPALQEVARRYLRAYGPATLEDFARWWELRLVPAKKLFQSLADELETVDVEGWRALALRTTLEPMQQHELAGAVRLLPLFDAYVLGLGRDRELEPLLPKAYQRQVYRPQGWISAVVLVDGYMRGVWEYTSGNSQTSVKVRMFASPTAAVRQGIEAEAERLGVLLNTRVVLAYE